MREPIADVVTRINARNLDKLCRDDIYALLKSAELAIYIKRYLMPQRPRLDFAAVCAQLAGALSAEEYWCSQMARNLRHWTSDLAPKIFRAHKRKIEQVFLGVFGAPEVSPVTAAYQTDRLRSHASTSAKVKELLLRKLRKTCSASRQ